MSIVNGGFEIGDFTDWQTIGDASIQKAEFGSGPTEGNYQALISNTLGSVSEAELEANLGLKSGALDSLNNGNVTEGSALQLKPITVKAGDVLSFDWNFLTNEGLPSFYNDFGFVTISSTSSELADTNSNFFFSNTIFLSETGYETFTYQFTQAGTFTIGLGVVDVEDTDVDSGLLVDNLKIVSPVKVIGTAKADVLKGTDGIDLISGLGGNDKISALAGNDEISGGSGDDLIHAGDGNDLANGEAGNDVIYGEYGNDTLTGSKGLDVIFGGDGNDQINGGVEKDRLFGEYGDDLVEGGDGDDIINGGDGYDVLYGGKGKDNLVGSYGSDTIYGEDGQDYLEGGWDYDLLLGGKGNDWLVGVDTQYGSGAWEIDTLTGGSGKDTFVLGDTTSVYYDDGYFGSTGEFDYALVTDFKANQDVIQLHGSAKLYSLNFYASGSGTTDAALVYTPGATDTGETIGILQGVSASLSLTSSAFTFV